MFDHFSVVAPFYERLARPVLDPTMLCQHLSLPTSGRLLDAGGGTGRAGQALRDMAGEIVVSDFSVGMLHQAAHTHGLPSVRSLVEQLPYADASFDRIVVVDAFHHFADHRAAIASMWRVLAPGGRLVIEEPNIDTAVVKFVGLAERAVLMRSRFFSPRDMGQMLEAAGARVQVFTDHPFNSWIVADKAAL